MIPLWQLAMVMALGLRAPARQIVRRCAWILVLLCSVPGVAFSLDLYCDPSAAPAGDGSLERPFQSFAGLNWNGIAGQVALGETVRLRLKAGAVFPETLVIQASGNRSRPLVIEAYGEGAPPVIAGDNPVSGWNPGLSPGLWTRILEGAPTFARLGPQILDRAAVVTNLADGEWFFTGKELRFRWDGGDPRTLSSPLRVGHRSYCVDLRDRHDVRIEGIALVGATAFGARVERCAGIEFNRCQFIASNNHLLIAASTTVVVRSSQFRHAFRNAHITVQDGISTLTCLFDLFHDVPLGSALFIADATAVDVVNCTLVGNGRQAVDTAAHGLVRLRNSIITGTGIGGVALGGEPIRSHGGTTTLENCLVLPNGRFPGKLMTGVTDLGGNRSVDPRYRRTRHEGLAAIVEDDYATRRDWFELADLASARGIQITFATDNTDRLTAEDRDALQVQILKGHEVLSHTRSHARLDRLFGLKVQYAGAHGTAAFSVKGNAFSVAYPEDPSARGLLLNLEDPRYARQELLAAYLNAQPGFQATLASPSNHRVPSRLLAEVTDLVVSNALVELPLDGERFFENEVDFSKADIERSFTNHLGEPVACNYMIYPGGAYSTNAFEVLKAAGFKGARIDSPAGGSWLTRRFNLYDGMVAPGDMMGTVCILALEDGSYDASAAGNAFTAHAIDYDPPTISEPGFAHFDGAQSYLSRSANPHFDFTRGDWFFAASIRPDASTEEHTVFYHGNGGGNAHRITVDAQGVLRLRVVRDGTTVLDLASPPRAVPSGVWTRIVVREALDEWYLRVNGTVVAQTISRVRPENHSTDVLIGAAQIDPDGQVGQYFAGDLRQVAMAREIIGRTTGVVDTLCEAGAMYSLMSHGESGTPRETWRTVLDTLKRYSGTLQVLTLSQAYDRIRTNRSSRFMPPADTSPTAVDAGDYRLRWDSPCIGGANPGFLSRYAGLQDASGLPVTDASGAFLMDPETLAMGALQPSLQILPISMPSMPLGASVDVTFRALGGRPPLEWFLTTDSATLPDGLTLSATGHLEGLSAWTGVRSLQLGVRDASGASVVQWVQLRLGVPEGVPFIESVHWDRDARLRLRLAADAGDRLQIEASSELQQWMPVDEVSVNDGPVDWNAPLGSGTAPVFYRVVRK